MKRELVAKRRNCKPVIAVSPEGTAINCYSISQAARIGFTSPVSVRKSIDEDKPVASGWRFSYGSLK